MTALPAGLPLGPDSISWRVTTEPSVIVFGAGRALLLQVLHPLVAAGVEDHSDYRSHPWRRLFRTLDTTMKLAYGDPVISERTAERLYRRHGAVTGQAPSGTPYRALDPALLTWVWATLMDTAVTVYRRAVRPLTPGEIDAFYEESKLVAYACGVPVGSCPETWGDFQEFMVSTIDRHLAVTPTTRAVAESIVNPSLPWPLNRLLGAAVGRPAATLLPSAFADQLELDRSERGVHAAFAVARLVAAVTPSWLRRVPLVPFLGRDALGFRVPAGRGR